MNRIDRLPSGKKRSAKRVEWFLQTVETGDGVEAHRKIWPDHHYPHQGANKLMEEFGPLLYEACAIANAADQLLAFRVKEKVLQMDCQQPVRDREGNPVMRQVCDLAGKPLFDDLGHPVMAVATFTDPRLLKIQVDTAGDITDRGLWPKGMAVHGLVKEVETARSTKDWRGVLDGLVARFGVEVVMGMPEVSLRLDYVGYLQERYPAKQVNALPAPAMEAEGVPRA